MELAKGGRRGGSEQLALRRCSEYLEVVELAGGERERSRQLAEEEKADD